MTSENPERPPRVRATIAAKIMSIDGTWGGEAQLINISKTEAELEAVGQTADLAEFFLLLTSFGQSVYRRCGRKWGSRGADRRYSQSFRGRN